MWEFVLGIMTCLAIFAVGESIRVSRKKEPVDDWVMDKVHHAMEDAGIPKEYRTLAVSNMQDAGILIRTKKVHNETKM